ATATLAWLLVDPRCSSDPPDRPEEPCRGERELRPVIGDAIKARAPVAAVATEGRSFGREQVERVVETMTESAPNRGLGDAVERAARRVVDPDELAQHGRGPVIVR